MEPSAMSFWGRQSALLWKDATEPFAKEERPGSPPLLLLLAAVVVVAERAVE